MWNATASVLLPLDADVAVRPATRPGSLSSRFGAHWVKYLLILFLLVGCQTFAPPSAPVIELPAAFPSQSGEHPLQDAWWRDFNDQELNALLDQAMRSGLSIRIALARLDQAQAAAAKTGSLLWPQADVSGNAAQAWAKPEARNVSSAQTFGLGLAASYELDLWGRVRALRQADQLAIEASHEDVRTAALTLSGEIVEAWISLCSTRQQLDVLARQQSANADMLSTLERRFANSLATALDVYQQREAMAQVDAAIPLLQAEIVRLENKVNQLLGKGPGESSLTGSALPVPMPMPETGLPSDLLAARPDIRAGWLRLEEAGWDLASAKADRLPAIRLTGKFEHEGDKLNHIFANWLANLAAALSAPIFDGGQRAAETLRQEAIRKERLGAYENTVFAALAEVDTKVSAAWKQQEHLDALHTQLDLAKGSLGSARTRYGQGLVAYETVLTQQLKVHQLERSIIQKHAELLIIQAGLCRALGHGWRTHFPIHSDTLRTGRS